MSVSRWDTLGPYIREPEWHSRQKSLVTAIESNGVDDLRKILDQAKASNHLTDALCGRILVVCCKADKIDCARLLLTEYNSNVRIQVGKIRTTALMVVRSAAMVDLLLGPTRSSHDQAAAVDDIDFFKRTPLIHAIRNKHLTSNESMEVVKALIRHHADVNRLDFSRRSALTWALIEDKAMIAHTLLDAKASFDAPDIQNRTLFMTAAWRNHIDIFQRLVDHGDEFHMADDQSRRQTHPVYAVDDRGRNVLHHICQDEERAERARNDSLHEHDDSIARAVLRLSVEIDGRDQEGRSPLHVASSHNNKHLAKVLLEHRASPNATDFQDRTPLHYACFHCNTEMVRLLIDKEAKVDLATDQQFTPLHVAAAGRETIDIVRLLLHSKQAADRSQLRRNSTVSRAKFINATTVSHKTALHIAAESDNIEVVEILLGEATIDVALQDVTGNTAMFNAARMGNKRIVELLAKYTYAALTEPAREASKGFLANIVDFKPDDTGKVNFGHARIRVRHLLEGETPVTPDFFADTKEGEAEPEHFRWIHLPSNNLAWCQELLVRRFLERDEADPESFKALQMSFNHEHVGTQPHARYMRPVCQLVPRSDRREDSSQRPTFFRDEYSLDRMVSTPADSQSLATVDPLDTSVKGKRSVSMPTISTGTGKAQSIDGSIHDSMYLFMPYMHYERTSALRRMRGTIAAALKNAPQPPRISVKDRTPKAQPPPVPPDPPRKRNTLSEDRVDADKKLIHAHINQSNSSVHVRRTLDQSFYRTIDTKTRDRDQVVLRYQRKYCDLNARPHPDGLKLLMVDQLWMWVVSGELIITSFPQRWEQDDKEHDDVFKAILHDLRSPISEYVANAYELAMFIAGHCAGMSDTRSTKHGETLFLDMFDAAIGTVTDEETDLFRRFESASEEASQWLQDRRTMPGIRSRKARTIDADFDDNDLPDPQPEQHRRSHFHEWAPEPPFIHTLLDIKGETKLTKEIKDIQDELQMLHVVISQQELVCNEAYDKISEAMKAAPHMDKQQRTLRQDRLRKINDELTRRIQNPLKDIERMQQQAGLIYDAIKDLLDLKQKYANAMQAADVARQSQIILVFTIVTVVFLPLSFLSSFFALQVDVFPRTKGQLDMSLGFVLKYVVGVGLGVALPCVVIALTLKKIRLFMKEWRQRIRHFFTGRPSSQGPRHVSKLWRALIQKEKKSANKQPTGAGTNATGPAHGVASGRHVWFQGVRGHMERRQRPKPSNVNQPNGIELNGVVVA